MRECVVSFLKNPFKDRGGYTRKAECDGGGELREAMDGRGCVKKYG